MRFVKEKHLRSENVGIDSIFEDEDDDDDDDSVTSMEILKNEVTFRVKKNYSKPM